MESKTIAIPVDVYDKDGNMTFIEFNDREGNFLVQAEWDQADEQNSENRVQFRKWSYKMVERLGYTILK
jgi:hypothetical protein